MAFICGFAKFYYPFNFCNEYTLFVSSEQIFFLNGRLIFGPDARSLIVTLLLILVPVVIFCAFVVINLIDEFPSNNPGYAILATTIIFTIYVSSLDIPFLCSVQ